MFENLRETEEKYISLGEKLADPQLTADIKKYAALQKEYSALSPLVEAYRAWKKAVNDVQEADELRRGSDTELAELAADEYKEASARQERTAEALRLLLIPKDPNDGKNVTVEIRAGTGGDEACLFAQDLFRMYSMYCASAGFRISVISENRTELGGIKKLIFLVEGEGAYSRLKFESGTHEVKRVPVTEANGRIQTSTATVAVMPEAEAVEYEINPADVLFETCKSSGAGGQHINKTDSAVRLTHIPTGTVVECQQERSQYQNRDRAMQILRTILLDRKRSEQEKLVTDRRRSLIGSGDRSERIRIYRYKDNLIRDMRLDSEQGSRALDSFMNGNIAGLTDALAAADTAAKLRDGN